MQAIYDDKVIQILNMLEKGMSREEVAESFRYSSHRSMDEFMRRKNFRWDKRDGIYVDANEVRRPSNIIDNTYPTEKVRRIVQAFNKESANPKEIAKNNGFKDHFDMAEYMIAKKYQWSEEIGNYTRTSGPNSTNSKIGFENEVDEGTSVPDYRFLLEWLSENREALENLLSTSGAINEIATLPRFTLPGLFVTKSVHMVNKLDQMVRDFSEEKNINQREIFEIALIEFFQKYGYKEEVSFLLEKREVV